MPQSQVHPHRALSDRQYNLLHFSAEAHVIASGRIPRQRDHIRSLHLRERFGKLEATQLRQTYDPAAPSRTYALESQTSSVLPALEAWVARTPREEVAHRVVLITQALRESRRGNLRKPLMPARAFPLGEPAREVIASECQPAFAIGCRTDLNGRVPQPADAAEPTIEQAALF
jgi:hypothetical protein